MKKFVRLFAVLLCVLVCGSVLAACGSNKKELKSSDVVGEWYVESNVYTYNGSTDNSTFVRFAELHNKADRTADEDDEYVDMETVILMFNVTEDGKLQYKRYYADASEYVDGGTWAIEDGKLTANITMLAGEKTIEYKDGKIIVTQTRMWLEKLETTVITLAKVAA